MPDRGRRFKKLMKVQFTDEEFRSFELLRPSTGVLSFRGLVFINMMNWRNRHRRSLGIDDLYAIPEYELIL